MICYTMFINKGVNNSLNNITNGGNAMTTVPPAWSRLKPLEQQFIQRIIPCNNIDKPKDAFSLLKIAFRRLNNSGLYSLKVCGKCNGVGKIDGFGHVYNGVCFKCSGSRFHYPKVTDKLFKDISNKLEGIVSIDKDGTLIK